jgi:hypothetical protein
MKRNFTLAIPSPCHEKWDQFTPTQKGLFCGACQKEVIDFTTWSEEQIKNYFYKRPASTCGRFATHQLTTYKSNSYNHSKRQNRWAAALTFLVLLISRPAEAQQSRIRAGQEQVAIKNNDDLEQNILVDRLTIRGIVVVSGDETDHLPGVNIVRKGTNQGVVSDAEGKFEMVINHPKAVETLVTSFIGLMTVEYQVPADSIVKEIKITMPYDMVAVSEVVVVGGVVATRWYSPRGLWWRLRWLFRKR